DIQLLRDQHRERGPHALPYLAATRAEHDATIRLDAHETPERLTHSRRQLHRHLFGDTTLRQDQRYREPARGAHRDLQELAPRERKCGRGAHQVRSVRSARAARWIALRMRG